MELEDVFRAHQNFVYAYVLRMVGETGEAEELTQETFYRACIAAGRFRGEASVRTWLVAIARRVVLEWLRERKRVDASAPLPERAEGSSTADERIDLERALISLGFEDRELLMLVDVLGFEPREVADLVDMPAGTIRVRLHRARARLREAYAR